mgnify:CR=1 FL=1
MTSSDGHDRSGAGAEGVLKTDLALPGARRGKVRDTYTLPGAGPGGLDAMCMIATDRISAFDVVMPTPIPGKGRVLTSIAAFWLAWIEREGLSGTHLIACDDALIPDGALTTDTTREHLIGRVTVGRMCRVVPVECVVRGYLEGSGWRDYQRSGRVCGAELPAGLVQCEKLPAPIFTPATKAEEGHDENIGFDAACAAADGVVEGIEGRTLMTTLRDRSLAIYERAAARALDRGIILADTKFEFGFPVDRDGSVLDRDPILIDEALTPDSSRFWPADRYEPGRAQPSFDKQFVREYLQGLVDAGVWDRTAPGPELPEHVVRGTIDRYTMAAAMLAGA